MTNSNQIYKKSSTSVSFTRMVIVAFIGYKDTYFVKNHSDAPHKYSDADVIQMLEYLIDNVFVEFCGRIYQLTIGIPMCINLAPLLAELFLYLYEAEFVQGLLRAGKIALHSNSVSLTDI